MTLCYDEAVKIALNAYHEFEYSSSCCSGFRIAAKEFKEYMQGKSLPYTFELSQQWIKDWEHHWPNYKLIRSQKAMNVILDIIEHGCVTTSLQMKVRRTPPYTHLPDWSKTLLDNYLESLSDIYKNSYLTQIKNTCSRFFLFLEYAGIKEPSGITHDVLEFFLVNRDNMQSSKTTKRDNSVISRSLTYMADQGLVQKSLGIVLNKSATPDLILISELLDPQRLLFMKYKNRSGIYYSSAEYEKGVNQLANIHRTQKHSNTIQSTDLQVTREFRIFMDANSLVYSNELALEWLEFQREKWSRAKYLTFRRVLLSINEILCTGTLSSSYFTTRKPKYSLPQWANDLLDQYLQERKREGCATSTLVMISNSCSRFFVFLNTCGIVDENGITPDIINDFLAQDSHRTVEGKNAYAIKIRGFLRFLARRGFVPKTLELAVSTDMAPHRSIVITLSEDQVDAIYAYRQTAKNAMDMRNAAVIILGLKMGFRASDIANLKLSDISWKESSISLVQQKTGVHVKLPMPIDAGNSLYRYINEVRPQSDSHHVFIHHRAPYCKMTKNNFTNLLKTIIPDTCEGEETNGFHITRKTFSSNLLEKGVPAPTIAAALGHVGLSAIDEYLATNEVKMRLCAIGLKGIEYSGGFRL